MVDTLTIVLIISAVITLIWGVERYRRRFVRTDLIIAVVTSLGLLIVAITPSVFDVIGDLLSINSRVLVVSFVSNLFLLGIVLYVIGSVRRVEQDLNKLVRQLSIGQTTAADGGAESIYILIPAYNEGNTIQSVVDTLPKKLHGHVVQPLVISDGSDDETAQRAAHNGTMVVEHPLNQGQGGAIKTGFQVAADNDASVVVTIDGDGQHPVEKVEALVAPILDDEADFVVGSRYRGQDQSNNGPVRKAGIRFFTWLINLLTKSDLTDCTNGFRAIRGRDLEKLTLTEERFNAPELLIEAKKNGLRIQELPMTVRERQAGETKKPQLGYAIGLARTILVTWLR